MLCCRIAPLVFPYRLPRGPLQRTALSKKLINQLFFVFIALCLQVNLRHRLQKQKVSKIRHLFASFVLCGEKGIRTPETLLTFTRFPGGPVQPLLHLSLPFCVTNIELISEIHNSTLHEQPTLQFNLQFFIQLLLILEDYTYICAILIQCADL